MEQYIGVDLHYKQVTYHTITRDDTGTIQRKNGMVMTNQLAKNFVPLVNHETHICVEATCSTYAFIDMIKDHAGSITVINPQDFKGICCSSKKTDRIDAKKLATRLKMHIEDGDSDDGFPSVYVPGKEVQQLRRLFSTYEFVNKQVVAVKNRISSFFKTHLVLVPRLTKSCNVVTMAERYGFDRIEIFQIKMLSEELSRLQEFKKEIKNEIIILGSKTFAKEIELLITIPGISHFTACSIMADVVVIGRFQNHKKFASYMRSAPRIYSSDSVTHIGRIDKKGRKLSYKYMIQGITHFRRTNPILRDLYDRKCIGKSKGKVRAAIIRKMMVTIYFMLKNNESYRFCDHELFTQKMKILNKKSQAAA